MAAVGSSETQPRSLDSFRAKPTAARPRHSLFGTALEKFEKSDLQGIDPGDAGKMGTRRQPERYPIPEDLQGGLSAKSVVDQTRSDISSQNQCLAEAQKSLKDKELQALAFRPQGQQREAPQRQRPGWLSKQDLEHSQDINITGLGKTGSYNRDRYAHKPPVHNYSLIGDVLSSGNEFGHPQHYDPNPALLEMNQSENNNLDAIRLGFNPPVDPDVECPLVKPKSAVQLPPNIKHQFGSRVCDSLLSDEKKVTDTIEKQRSEGRQNKPRLQADTKDFAAKAVGSYFDVGQKTRYNVFPGHSMLEQKGCTQSVHNDVVYLRRNPMTDEYRVTKDGYSIWREQAFMAKKLEHLWSNFFSTQPKFSANWDRNQTRPQPTKPAAPAPARPKPKPRAKPTPKGKAEEIKKPEPEPLFEDFVFTTPPVTPPPPPLSPAKLPANAEKDKEFWALYDKN